jgi:beta-lactamase regulating signal transducer with metallopeptidase domain
MMNSFDFCGFESELNRFAPWMVAYLVHSTIIVALIWLVTRKLPRQHLAAANVLWRAALILPLLTTAFAQFADPARGPWGTHWALSEAVSDGPQSDHALKQVQRYASGAAIAPTPADSSTPSRVEDRGGLHFTARTTQRQVPLLLAIEHESTPVEIEPSPASHVAAWWIAVVVAVGLSALGTFSWCLQNLRLLGLLRRGQEIREGRLVTCVANLCRRAGIDQAPRLFLASSLSTPVVLNRRRIYLPHYFGEELDEATFELIQAAIAHELGHIARSDPSWYAAGHLLRALFAFAPLQGLIVRELARTMEPLCDDWAVGLLGGNLELAKSLAWVASKPQLEFSPPMLSAMTMHQSSLSQRVNYILQDRAGTWPRRVGLRTLAVTMFLGLCVGWGAPSLALNAAPVKAVEPAPEIGAQQPAPPAPPAKPVAPLKAAKPAKASAAVKSPISTKAKPINPPAPSLPAPLSPPPAPNVDEIDLDSLRGVDIGENIPPPPPIAPLIEALNIPDMVDHVLAVTLPATLEEVPKLTAQAAALGQKAAEVDRLQKEFDGAKAELKADLGKKLNAAKEELKRAEAKINADAKEMEARIEAKTKDIEVWAEAFEKEMAPKMEAIAAEQAAKWEAWGKAVEARAHQASAQREHDRAQREKEKEERAKVRNVERQERAEKRAKERQNAKAAKTATSK